MLPKMFVLYFYSTCELSKYVVQVSSTLVIAPLRPLNYEIVTIRQPLGISSDQDGQVLNW